MSNEKNFRQTTVCNTYVSKNISDETHSSRLLFVAIALQNLTGLPSQQYR